MIWKITLKDKIILPVRKKSVFVAYFLYDMRFFCSKLFVFICTLSWRNI